jgi:uncharacterized protein
MKREDLLDLNDALQHPGRVISVDISTELEDEGELDLVRPVEGYLEAVSTGNLLLVKGEFSARAVVDCARCSNPVEQDLAFTIDEQFPVEGTPSMYNPQDYARVVPDEPYELFEGNSLMVEALLRQGALLAMPIQALCEFGWDGDCPKARHTGFRSGQAAGRPEFEGLSHLLKREDSQG